MARSRDRAECRKVQVKEEHRHCSVVAADFFSFSTHSFGARNLVWRFNCSARVFQEMACVEFALGVTHFFDDCTQVEPAATALSAKLTQLTHFFSQVGYDLKSNDNGRERLRTHRRCSGRRVRLQQHTNGPFDIRNKGRHAKHAVKERLLRPSVARSLGPRLGFACQTFGRVGMLGMRALQDAAGRGVSLARKEVEYFLRSWRHLFANVRPRKISVQEEMPVLFLTERRAE